MFVFWTSLQLFFFEFWALVFCSMKVLLNSGRGAEITDTGRERGNWDRRGRDGDWVKEKWGSVLFMANFTGFRTVRLTENCALTLPVYKFEMLRSFSLKNLGFFPNWKARPAFVVAVCRREVILKSVGKTRLIRLFPRHHHSRFSVGNFWMVIVLHGVS